jgi:hypothetical protein
MPNIWHVVCNVLLQEERNMNNETDFGTLHNLTTGEYLRSATKAEAFASTIAAAEDDGCGAIEVDNVACYVDGPEYLPCEHCARSLDYEYCGIAEYRAIFVDADDKITGDIWHVCEECLGVAHSFYGSRGTAGYREVSK